MDILVKRLSRVFKSVANVADKYPVTHCIARYYCRIVILCNSETSSLGQGSLQILARHSFITIDITTYDSLIISGPVISIEKVSSQALGYHH